MAWKIAEAKKRFSEMIHRVHIEPQVICNRDSIVAVVIDPGQYEEYTMLKENREKESIGTAFEQFREICEEESYEIAVPKRKNRKSSWQE
ncbi:MAG TPA: type II toxin-antitoxin system Phd/YefM family antitoxin [Spirochaetota bacterium]|nr:type II toxin-antitoxin system Phd/YefM family antitoxin [Spirochaetota bacterium]HPR49818.1 type II toxin-antitoxin system Phd/YefM family antitoxin [Spirochaetota bacterium]